MTQIDTVLLKVSSRCNLDCEYCYVYRMGDEGWRTQPKRMPHNVETAVIEQLAELASAQSQPFSVVLHGGEPLLIGVKRLGELFERLRCRLPDQHGLHLQTNGILLTAPMIDMLAENCVGISISVDGPAEVHDRFRIDRRGRGSYESVAAAIQRLREHTRGEKLFSGVLAVVDPSSDPAEIYEALKSTGTPSIDFLYRDGNHSNLPFGKSDLHSTEYGTWMCRLLDLYLVDSTPPRIRILDDMLKLLLGGYGTKEGVGVTDYGIVVVDTDGSIRKNDTLKSTFSMADRFGTSWSVLRDRLIDVINAPEFHNYHVAQRPTSPICHSCPELGVCGGGMPAHRWSDGKGFDNPSVFCDDQQLLISEMRRWIAGLRPAVA